MSNNSPQAGAGLLIVGHGTRDERGCASLPRLTSAVAALSPETIVEAAFWSWSSRTSLQGVQRAIERGAGGWPSCRCYWWRPAMPGATSRDQFGSRHGTLSRVERSAKRRIWALTRPCSNWPSAAIVQALAERADVAGYETLLLIVGRGTKDPAANAELCHFCPPAVRADARRLAGDLLSGDDRTIAGDGPWNGAAIALSRVVVEPHFLFQGELLDRVREMVAGRRALSRERNSSSPSGWGPKRCWPRPCLSWPESRACRTPNSVPVRREDDDISSILWPNRG